MSRAEAEPSPEGGSGGKVTVEAPSNIALVKYWGARNLEEGIPENRSLSMTLRRCVSRCTVELLGPGREDEIYRSSAAGELRPAAEEFAAPVARHLGRIREWAGVEEEIGFRVATRNSFPTGAGLASSASGFAALTAAAAGALGAEPSAEELSVLARRSGSGSAARSLFGGFVEWPRGGGEDGFDPGAPAAPFAGPDHWDLRDVIAVVDPNPKKVSSREGHRRAPTSPHYPTRLRLLRERTREVRRAVLERDMARLAPAVEEETVEMHMVAMTSRPPVWYWTAETMEVLRAVRALRAEGVGACYTLDAGPNVHVLCEGSREEEVSARLSALPAVERVIRDGVGAGPVRSDDHLL